MPRYFFNVFHGAPMMDSVGTNLPGLDEAKREALDTALVILKDCRHPLWGEKGWCLEVSGEDSRILLRLSFAAEETALR